MPDRAAITRAVAVGGGVASAAATLLPWLVTEPARVEAIGPIAGVRTLAGGFVLLVGLTVAARAVVGWDAGGALSAVFGGGLVTVFALVARTFIATTPYDVLVAAGVPLTVLLGLVVAGAGAVRTAELARDGVRLVTPGRVALAGGVLVAAAAHSITSCLPGVTHPGLYPSCALWATSPLGFALALLPVTAVAVGMTRDRTPLVAVLLGGAATLFGVYVLDSLYNAARSSFVVLSGEFGQQLATFFVLTGGTAILAAGVASSGTAPDSLRGTTGTARLFAGLVGGLAAVFVVLFVVAGLSIPWYLLLLLSLAPGAVGADRLRRRAILAGAESPG